MQAPLNQVPGYNFFRDESPAPETTEAPAKEMLPPQQIEVPLDQALNQLRKTPADVSVERPQTVRPPLPKPGRSSLAECAVVSNAGESPADKVLRVNKELLGVLSRIATATAMPADELSALARNAVEKHSRPS